jgi:hypothetical protein
MDILLELMQKFMNIPVVENNENTINIDKKTSENQLEMNLLEKAVEMYIHLLCAIGVR